MGLGPTRLLRDGGLTKQLEALGLRVEVEEIEPVDESMPEIARVIELDRRLAVLVRESVDAGSFPLVLAGNCNSCLGTVAGVGPEGLGVIWFDAHADFDTAEDNVSGFFDVMGLSILTGSAFQALSETIPGFSRIEESHVLLAGVRDLEPYQERRLRGSEVQALFGERLRREGLTAALEPAVEELRSSTSTAYLHLDLDSLDPSEGRANEYAAPGGLSLAELEDGIDLVFERFRVRAAAVTAYNPEEDPEGRMLQTAQHVITAVARNAR
jgi:arginase